MEITVLTLQNAITKNLNIMLDGVGSDCGAFKATTRDGEEYVEVCNPDHSKSFIITIVKRVNAPPLMGN